MAADYAERARAAADFYAARGMRVHPCRGKVPLTRWSAAATTDPAQLATWWAPGSTANVAIATGGGLVVLDVDVDHSAGKYGDETLAHLEQEHGALPATWTCLTGGGGVHYYFRCDDPRLSVGTQIAPGLDYRGPGGYVIAPPSVHPTTGRTYEWEVNGHPFAVPLAPLPEWLHELMLKGREREKKTGQDQEAAEPIMEGGRNDAIFREAARLRAAGLTLQELLAAVGEINRQRCQPPLEDAEIETICKSAARYPRGGLYGAPAFSPLADPPAPQALASSPEEYGPAAVDAFLEAVQGERYKPIPTGLSAIDAALGGGLMRQTLVVLGAAPGMGKTALAAQIGESLAKTGAADVLYINLEMSREQLLARSLARLAWKQGAEVPALKVLQGYSWTMADRQAIERAAAEYKATIAPRLVYNPGADTTDLEAIMGKIQAEQQRLGRAPVVVLDYLQLLTCRSERREEDAAATIKRAVQRLKEYAIKENTIVLAITANNRASMSTGESGLNSGRDTSNIEYGADVHLGIEYAALDPTDGTKAKTITEIRAMRRRYFANREDPQAVADYNNYCTRYAVKVNKNRHGAEGRQAVLHFDGERALFIAEDTRHKEPRDIFRPTKRL